MVSKFFIYKPFAFWQILCLMILCYSTGNSQYLKVGVYPKSTLNISKWEFIPSQLSISQSDSSSQVNSRYLKVGVHPKLLISESKLSGPRKFILRHQYFEVIGVEIKQKYRLCPHYIFFKEIC